MSKKELMETGAAPQERKKGLMRMIELLDRDSGKFFKSGVLALLGLVPFFLAVLFALANNAPVLLLACIPTGMLAAPEIAGAADTVMRSLRDEVGWWWWDTYKKAWKRNARETLLPGAILGLVIGLYIYLLYYITLLSDPTKEFWMLFAAMLVLTGIAQYYLPMLVCMELPNRTLLRNCFVLFFSHPVKSLLAALLQLIYYGIMLIWFPLTLVILVLTSVWLPMLIACVILYPALDKHLNLTAVYEKLQQQQWGGGQ
ncbi:MAG: hypothetical protein ACI3XG_07280 [Faecousia sp.]